MADMAIYRLLESPGDEDMKPRSSFEGFVPPTKNYFHMPNQWIDICAKIDSLSELKVIQYVLRHTWGYQEYDGVRNITVDEFMYGRKRKDGTRIDNGTGLSEPSVKDGIKRAIRHGYMVCTIDDKDKARIKKYYGLRMAATSEYVGVRCLPSETGGQASYPLGVTFLSPEGKHLTARGQETFPRSEKDTLERHLEKDTSEIQEDMPSSSDDAPTPLFVESFIALDSIEHPTIMTIYLTPKDAESEMEDERRLQVAASLRVQFYRRGFATLDIRYARPETTRAEHQALEKVVDEKIHDTDNQLKAVSSSHAAIRNVIPPAISLPAKGATIYGRHTNTADCTHDNANHLEYGDLQSPVGDPDRTPGTQLSGAQAIIPQQAPSTPVPLPVAAEPPVSREGDAGGAQANSSRVSEPAQAVLPPGSSSPTTASSAQASGRSTKRPRGKSAVLELSLMGMDVKRWIEEIRGAKLRMTENTVRACNTLAETDGVSLEALRVYFAYMEEQGREVDLLTVAGETGNTRVGWLSFESNWQLVKRRLQPAIPPPETKKDEPERGVSGLPKYRPGKVVYS